MFVCLRKIQAVMPRVCACVQTTWLQCKILGESVNTVVQTLIAGSFTPFMTWRVFWLL